MTNTLPNVGQKVRYIGGLRDAEEAALAAQHLVIGAEYPVVETNPLLKLLTGGDVATLQVYDEDFDGPNQWDIVPNDMNAFVIVE